jgi:hypothetical protein
MRELIDLIHKTPDIEPKDIVDINKSKASKSN